jgi:hypothetical protein
MNRKLPTLQDLRSDIELKADQNALNVLLNAEPPKDWVKEHPVFKKVRYLPIERVEYLLTRIFLKWNVEVKAVQVIANSIVTTIRLYYQDPMSDQMLWQDGIGAAPLQTDKGAGAVDFNAIKSDAVMKAAPAAESYAIKDAAEKIGKLFGKDLNRADKIMYDSLLDLVQKERKLEEIFEETT